MLRVGVHPDPATVPRRGPSPRSHGWYAAVRMYTGMWWGRGVAFQLFISKSTKRSAQRSHYWCRHAIKWRSGKARFDVAGDGCIVGNELLFRIFIRRALIRRKLPAAICSQTLPLEERIRRREQLYGQLRGVWSSCEADHLFFFIPLNSITERRRLALFDTGVKLERSPIIRLLVRIIRVQQAELRGSQRIGRRHAPH